MLDESQANGDAFTQAFPAPPLPGGPPAERVGKPTFALLWGPSDKVLGHYPGFIYLQEYSTAGHVFLRLGGHSQLRRMHHETP